MHDIAIKVENMSKRYRIGLKEKMHDTFIGSITSWIKSPFSNFKQLQQLSKFSDNGNSKDIIWALKDISFKVERGQVMGIIGSNGSGKSTLLKILSGITEPTEGRAVVSGRVGSLLEVGTGFHPELTGRENLYLSGTILGMKKKEIDRKFDEIVDFSGIEKFIDTPVKRYSTGMAVRLAFSVAAHLDPEILLIDEVLAVGDAEFQKKCLGKMDNVASGGRTVLFVSHNMLAVNSLCSKGLVLDKGKILLIDKVDIATKKYLSNRIEKTRGEIIWDNRYSAPGDDNVRLHQVRIVSEGKITGTPELDKKIAIEIDYWNIEDNVNRLISIHLLNDQGIVVFTSDNSDDESLEPDEWFRKKYDQGLFTTKCIIPPFLLNEGIYTVHVFVNRRIGEASIIKHRNAISFSAEESPEMRNNFKGKRLGVIHPKLMWSTDRVDDI